MTWNTPLFISDSLVYTSIATPTKWEKSLFFHLSDKLVHFASCDTHGLTFPENNYSKLVFSGHSKKGPKICFQDWLLLNAGQKYCRMLQGKHSAILSTFIKLQFVFETHVLSIFEWTLNIELFRNPLFSTKKYKNPFLEWKCQDFAIFYSNVIMDIIT